MEQNNIIPNELEEYIGKISGYLTTKDTSTAFDYDGFKKYAEAEFYKMFPLDKIAFLDHDDHIAIFVKILLENGEKATYQIGVVRS